MNGVLVARDLPLYPLSEMPDERTEDVLLLDHDDECKTTAEPRIDATGPVGWRIVEWEVEDFDGQPHWFARCWHTIPDQHIAILAGHITGGAP